MRWEEYKQLCDHPAVLTRWLIEQTARICDPNCSRVLEAVLETAPITKPAEHKGGVATDMFSSSLSRENIELIIEQVQRAVATGERTTGPIERDYTSIEKAWLEYLHWRNDTPKDQESPKLQEDSN